MDVDVDVEWMVTILRIQAKSYTDIFSAQMNALYVIIIAELSGYLTYFILYLCFCVEFKSIASTNAPLYKLHSKRTRGNI